MSSVKYYPEQNNWNSANGSQLKAFVLEAFSKAANLEGNICYNEEHHRIEFRIKSYTFDFNGLGMTLDGMIPIDADALNAALETSSVKVDSYGWSGWIAGGGMTEFLQLSGLEVLSNLKTVNGKEDNYQAIADLMWECRGLFTGKRYGI